MNRSAARSLALPLICLTLLTFCGCSKKVDLKLRLNPGDSRTVTITQDLQITQEFMGNKMTQPVKTRQVFAMNVESIDAEGWATVNVTFKDYDLPDMGGFGGGFGEMGDLGDLSLEGKGFTMAVSPDGRVTAVRGMNAIATELGKKMKEMLEDVNMDSFPMPPQMQAQMKSKMGDSLQTMLRERAGDDAIREQMEQVFAIYPDMPVGVGDSWTKTQALSKGMAPMTISEAWTLTGRKDGVATLECQAEIAPNPSARPLKVMGVTVKMELTGKQTTTVEVDEKTGWILTSTTTEDLQGTTEAGPMSIPVHREGTTWVQTAAQ